MPTILLKTKIKAPRVRVFDLARNIDAHVDSTLATNERAIAGKTSGFIDLGETVTWEAKHFGVRQQLKVKITDYKRPHIFVDEMISGAFKSMKHIHLFEENHGITTMTDEFQFSSSFGIIGNLAERLFLTRYMESFLRKRNNILKELAESDDWKKYITH